MNRIERQDWLEAVSESFPPLRTQRLRAVLKSLDGFSKEGSWEIGMGSRTGFQSLGFRYRGRRESFSSWLGRAAKLFDLPLDGGFPAAPPEGFPWLSLTWSLESDAQELLLLLGKSGKTPHAASGLSCNGALKVREKVLHRLGRFTPRLLGEPALEKAFGEFIELCPVRGMISEWTVDDGGGVKPREGWGLRLRNPLPWPHFLRMDIASPFAGRSSQLAFLNLNRGIGELRFSGEALWVY